MMPLNCFLSGSQPQRLMAWSLLSFSCFFLGVGLEPAHAQAQEQAQGSEFARVVFMSGQAATVERPSDTSSQRRPLANQSLVYQGDLISTGLGASVHLLSFDGALVVVRPESVVFIRQYDFKKDRISDSSFAVDIQKGAARFVSGDIATRAKSRFRVNTPLAAIGVRGTDFSVFTTVLETKVSVNRGQIVMAPLAADCMAGGLGPCTTAKSQELSASRTQFLFLRLDAGTIERSMRFDQSPDGISPPDASEPVLGSPAGASGKNALADPASPTTASGPNASSAVSSALAPQLVGASRGSGMGLETDVRFLQTSGVRDLEEPLVHWGRWKTLAGLTAEQTDTLFPTSRQLVAILDTYGLAIDKQSLLTPTLASGKASFRLRDYEVISVTPRTGFIARMQVDNPSLEVDFSRAEFATGLSLRYFDRELVFRSKGTITAEGRMVNDPNEWGQQILRGTVAGSDATQAGYLFSLPNPDTGAQINGATRWVR